MNSVNEWLVSNNCDEVTFLCFSFPMILWFMHTMVCVMW